MTTDLLGHPIPDPPPMTAPLPWRVFQMNDVIDWVMARTEREAIGCLVEWCNMLGDSRTEDELRAAGIIGAVRELTDSELENMDYGDTNMPDPDEHTFADELASLALHAHVPMFFASTEC